MSLQLKGEAGMTRNRKPYFFICFVVLLLTFSFCLVNLSLADESSLKIDDESIKVNIEKAEPLIKEVTGLSFKETMKYELVKREAFRDSMAAELLPIYKTMMKGATDDIISRQVEASAVGMSQSTLGKYSPFQKKLLLIPDNAQAQVERYEIKMRISGILFFFLLLIKWWASWMIRSSIYKIKQNP